MKVYLFAGLDKQRHLVPMVLINAESIEAAATKLAGTIVEKNDQRYKEYFQADLEFGRLEPSLETGIILMAAVTGIGISGDPSVHRMFAEQLTDSYPFLLLGLLRQT